MSSMMVSVKKNLKLLSNAALRKVAPPMRILATKLQVVLTALEGFVSVTLGDIEIDIQREESKVSDSETLAWMVVNSYIDD